jgi:hypothetical protein
MLLHGGRLSLTTDARHWPHPPELQGTHLLVVLWQVTLPAVQVPCWQQG